MRPIRSDEAARPQIELLYDELISTYLDKRFVPREWLAERVQQALGQLNCRFVLLTAEPGAGKSAFMAWLASRHSQWQRYFIRRDQRAPLDEPGQRSFLRRIGYQMAATYPDLFRREAVELRVQQYVGSVVKGGEVIGAEVDRILASPFHQTALQIRQEVEQSGGRVVGLRVREVIAESDLLPIETLQNMALFNPAEVLQKERTDSRVVVLVDALDELKYRPQEETVLNWLETCRELPSNIRFVLTSRPDRGLLARFRGAQGERIVEIEDFERDANVLGDLEAYARSLANEPAIAKVLGSASAVEAFVRNAVDKANGNLGYLNAIARAVDAAVKTDDRKLLIRVLALQELPGTLQDLYGYFLSLIRSDVGNRSVAVTDSVKRKRFYLDAWPAVYRRVLGVLSVAHEPLRSEQVRLLGGIDADQTEVDQALTRFEQFLNHEGEGVRLYHATLPEFLSRPETRANPTTSDFAIDPLESHVQVAAAYFDLETHSLHWPRVDAYGLRHLAAHLTDADAWVELRELLTDFDFLEGKCRALSVYDLEADYRAALASWRGDSQGREVLGIFEERLRLESHHINSAPELLFPQLYSHLVCIDPSVNGGELAALLNLICERAGSRRTNWLRMLPNTLLGHPSRDEYMGGHRSAVTAVTVTPDGNKIVSASDDRSLKVWDLGSGRLLRSLKGHTDSVTDVAVTPDGSKVVSGSSDLTLRVWDLASGRLLRSDHPGFPRSGREKWRMAIALTFDGGRVILGSTGGIPEIWDLASGRRLRSLEDDADLVTDIAVTSDDNRVVWGSRDEPYIPTSRNSYSLKVWDLTSDHMVYSINGSVSIKAVALTPDRSMIISAYDDASLKVWDLISGRLLRSLKGHNVQVLALAVTPDGSKIVSGCSDGTLDVWDLSSGRLLRSFQAHDVHVTAVAVTPDSSKVVSGSWAGDLKVWDLTSAHQLCSVKGYTEAVDKVKAVMLPPDGSKVVSWSSNMIKVWDLASSRLLHSTEGRFDSAKTAAVTPDGRTVVLGCFNRSLQVWDLPSARLLNSLEGYEYWTNRFVLTPDGSKVVWGASNMIKVWDLGSGRLLRSLKGHTRSVTGLAVTPDGSRVVSGSEDRTLKVWDLASGCLLCSLESEAALIGSAQEIVLTADASKLVSASGRTLEVWDLISGRLLCSIAHTYMITAIAVMPDSCKIVSRTMDRPLMGTTLTSHALQVRDLASGHLMHSLEQLPWSPEIVGGTPDGNKVLLWSSDKTFKVWDLITGDTMALFHSDIFACQALSHDSRNLVCGDEDGRIWMFEWVK